MAENTCATGGPHRIKVTQTVAPAKIKVVGTPGPQGPQGAQGPQGERGESGEISSGASIDGGNF